MSLHPDRTFGDSHSPTTRDPIEAVELFAKSLTEHLESDYGDWMREANVAWLDLVESLSPLGPPVQHMLEVLHDMIQYNSSWHPMDTCRRAILIANQIRREYGVGDPIDLHRLGIGYTEPETPMTEYEIQSPFPHHHPPDFFERQGIPKGIDREVRMKSDQRREFMT